MNQVSIAGRGETTVVKYDEEPIKVKIEKIASLKPAFKPADGTVSPASRSTSERETIDLQGPTVAKTFRHQQGSRPADLQTFRHQQ